MAEAETTDMTEHPKQAMNSPPDTNGHKCFHFITQAFGLGWFNLIVSADELFCVQSICTKQREYLIQQAIFKLGRSFFYG